MDLVYLVGPPAAGKSTLMAALTSGCDKTNREKPLPHQVLLNPMTGRVLGAEMGRPRWDFPGTDTLAMNISPVAKQWISTVAQLYPLVLGEGDRLAFPAFIEAAINAGVSVTLVNLTTDPTVLDRRCGERGSAQNATWRKGRATKAARLALWAAPHCKVVEIDSGSAPAAHLAVSLHREIPVLDALPWPR